MTNNDPGPAQGRAWPARVSGGLLLIQGAAILLNFWYLLSQIDLEASLAAGVPSVAAVDLVTATVMFCGPALIAVLASFGLLLRRSSAWLAAMTAEGLLLASSLYFHFYLNGSSYHQALPTYVIMASAIVMVFYLNSADVRLAFTAAPRIGRRSEEIVEHGL